MRNQQLWQPSKFVQRDGRWMGSRDTAKLSPGSRLIGDILGQAYAEMIEQHASGRLLDLGCGRVPLYGMYRDRVSEVVCADWPETTEGRDFVDIAADLNQGIDLPDASFDTILSTDVLEHLWNPGQAWADMARLLRPGGKLLLGVPYLYGIHMAPHDYFRYTEFALRRFCDEAGLKLLRIEAYGGRRQVMADLAVKSLYRHAGWIRWLAKPLIWWGRRGGNDSDRKHPLGYTLIAQKP